MRPFSYFIFVVAFIISKPLLADCHELGEFDWLLGRWQERQGDKVTIESWQRVSRHTIEGKALVTGNNKIAHRESLRLVKMGDGIFYIAKVSHNKLPIAFKLVYCGQQRYVFENTNHDFSKQIIYRKVNANRLEVLVGDGKNKAFKVEYERVQSN